MTDLASTTAELLDPRKIRLDRLNDDGTVVTKYVEISSILDELVAAVGSSIDAGGQARGRSTGSVLNLAALDLLDRIRVGTADWCDAWLGAHTTPLVGHAHPERQRTRRDATVERSLRRLVVHGWTGHETQRDQLARLVASWTRDARALLDGEREYRSVRGIACPACDGDTVWERNDVSEIVRGWPLVVDLRDGWVRGITCRLCGAYWWRSTEDLGRLAAALGLDVDRVILALSHYETVEAAGRAA